MNCLRVQGLAAAIGAAMLVASCGSTNESGGGGSAGSGGSRAPAIDAPDALGAFAVGHTMFTGVDAARDDRELPVNVWYPVDEADAATEPRTEYPLTGPFTLASEVAVNDLPVSSAGPLALLVFSHGYGGINTQSTRLMETLASHGFIVASPSHTGNTAFDSSDDMPHEKRVPDVSFVIDSMVERSNAAGDAFEGRLDESQIGVLGHSFGGQTAMGMLAGFAGADPDPRVKAIGVIAGGVGSGNFTDEELASVTAPTLLLVGTLDPGAFENHNYAFTHMPNAEGLFKVEITDANHTHFANVCEIGNYLLDDLELAQDSWPGLGAQGLIQPYNDTCTDDVFPIAEAIRLQNLYMVAHFKRYLLGETGYDYYLSAAYADTNEPAISFVAQ
jgi:predicted dienelactone hydrolase